MRFGHLFTAAACAAALSGTAFAQSFSGEDVEALITLMDRAEDLRDKYPDAELRASLPDGPMGFSDMLGADGSLKLFSTIASRLGDAPANPATRDFETAVKESGFGSLDRFGTKADAIMMAYMALSMGDEAMEGLEQMKNMDPSMLSMMPAGVRDQMDAVAKMAEAIQTVPDEDVSTLKPYEKRLTKAFDQ